LNIEDVNDLLDGICAIANQRNIFYLWRPITSDPDDDFLIDLAIELQANFIITYNLRDLRSAEGFGIKVITPSGDRPLSANLSLDDKRLFRRES